MKSMTIERIVSFLPSATELLYELGVKDRIFGVTHECLYPEDAKSKPMLSREALTLRLLDTDTHELRQKFCLLPQAHKVVLSHWEEKTLFFGLSYFSLLFFNFKHLVLTHSQSLFSVKLIENESLTIL